jgi:Glycosyl transferases group 1
MRIWLVQTGEELPLDGAQARLLRTAILAETLASRGHDVTYLNATFNHQRKMQRSRETQVIEPSSQISASYRIVLLKGCAYRRNISASRFLSHHQNARAFAEIAPKLAVPDVILVGYPPAQLAKAAVQYANQRSIPIAVDCRDMWPEIIGERLPALLRFFAAPFLQRMERMKSQAMAGASAITGISEKFVEWGLSAARREKGAKDRPFRLTVSSTKISDEARLQAQMTCSELLKEDRPNRLYGCFAGTLSTRLDLTTLLDGLDLLSAEERDQLRIILCGKGDLDSEIRQRCKGNTALIFAGWRNSAELAVLMQRSDFGILPYPNTDDFLASYPNKVGEYLLAGLPIMTGLKGLTGALLEKYELKVGYSVGNAHSVAHCFRRMLLEKADLRDKRATAEAVGNDQFSPKLIYGEFSDWLEGLQEGNGRQNDD